MALYHQEFQQALRNLKMRDVNEVASASIARLNSFPVAPRDRVVKDGSTVLDYTGAYCDTTWDETVGSMIAVNAITLDQMNTVMDLLVTLTNSISSSNPSAVLVTINSISDLIESNHAQRKTYKELGYSYDIKQQSTNDIRAFLEKLINIDVTASLWIISGYPYEKTVLNKFVKCVGYALQNVEQIGHALEQIRVISYSS